MKPNDRAPLATNSSAIERPAPILSHDTGVTHSFFTAVLKEITGILNLASVCAARRRKDGKSADDRVDPVAGKLGDDRVEGVIAGDMHQQHLMAGRLEFYRELLEDGRIERVVEAADDDRDQVRSCGSA